MSSTSATIQVVEFVAALASCWKKLAAYPSNHPEVVASLDKASRRLAELRGPAGEVVLGVTARGFVYGTLDVTSFAAEKLARTLYSRGVAVLRLGNETTPQEIATFLRLLTAGTSADQKRPLWDDLTAAGVLNINLQPVSYGTVQLTDSVREKSAEERPLWDDVLRALLDNQQFADFCRDMPARLDSADDLARMIAEYAATEEERLQPVSANATSGIRLHSGGDESFHRFFFQTVGRQIASSTGMKRQHSLEQAVQLLRSLPHQLRQGLIRAIAGALAADETAGALLRDFVKELPGDAVLEALRYLSSTGTLSSHALRLLESMTPIEASRRGRANGSAEVLGDVIGLFGEDDVARFNPTEHDATLRTLSVEIPQLPTEALSGIEIYGERLDPASSSEVMRHFSDVLLDLMSDGEASGTRSSYARLEKLFEPLLAAGEFDHLMALIHRLHEIARAAGEDLQAASDELFGRISDAVVEKMINATPEQMQPLQRLADTLDGHARRSLLVKLATEENRGRRRRLLNLAAAQGTAIVPLAREYLADPRWYVVRNMIVLLRSAKDRTSLPDLQNLARHPDLRVRMEALKSLFAIDSSVPGTLLDELFNDPDPKIGQAAIGLAGTYAIREAVDPLLRIVDGNDYGGTRRALRVKALHALGEVGDTRALTPLRRFFTTSWLPWPSREERYAAWESLAHYPADARRPLVDRGLNSADAYIRDLCARMKG